MLIKPNTRGDILDAGDGVLVDADVLGDSSANIVVMGSFEGATDELFVEFFVC